MSTDNRVPILDLSPEVDELWPQLMDAIQSVLRSTQFIMGPNVKAFEQEVAQYLGTKYAIAVNSGTDALVIALRAIGVGSGDEVITTPFTFFATAEAISQVGATPVFVDIDPNTLNINADLIQEAITPKTRAILPVHLYGNPSDMDKIVVIAKQHGLKVVEDCAQSFGAKYRSKQTGTIGDVGCYSFFPSKNLGAYGDGGLIATDDDDIVEYAKMLRVHGSRRKYFNEEIGYNSRLDEIQAAVLRVKLPHIDDWNAGRQRVAETYSQRLKDVPQVKLVTPQIEGTAVYHQYTIRVLNDRRDELKAKLDEVGIGTMIYYPVPVHKLPVYRGQSVQMPIAEEIARQAISLPIWPQLQEDVITEVVDRICRALEG